MPILIDTEKCTGCGECIRLCVPEAMSVVDGAISIDRAKCVQCGACAQVCPNQALELVLEAVPVRQAPEVIELQAKPVVRPSSDGRSGEWLGLLGRAAVGLVTFFVDRAASSDGPTSGRRTGGAGRMNRMRRRGRGG